MAKFITTIQLQDANELDYQLLKAELKKDSFKNEKHAAKSEAYITGKGTFSVEGNVTIEDVTRAVFKAAARTGKKYSFFTVKNKQVSYSMDKTKFDDLSCNLAGKEIAQQESN